MPPRLLTAAIIIAWLGMSSWLFYRDLWPQLRPGEAPPFRIDFSDEVLAKRPPVHWTVFKNGREMYGLKTEMSYDADLDVFEISGELKPKSGPAKDVPLAERLSITSVYVVTREGELRKSLITLQLPVIGEARMEGEVRDGRLYSWVGLTGSQKRKELEPVGVEAKGGAQNPLQPPDRFTKLSPGQRWRATMSSPLLDALSGLLPGIKDSSVQFLDAEVLREEQYLSFGTQEERCMIIEYTGDDTRGRTWVRVSDGFVLKQEMTLHDDEWEIRRVP
jgi:hypothetical protein